MEHTSGAKLVWLTVSVSKNAQHPMDALAQTFPAGQAAYFRQSGSVPPFVNFSEGMCREMRIGLVIMENVAFSYKMFIFF